MENLCNIVALLVASIKDIICNEILQWIVRHRRMVIAVLFLELEAAAFVLEQIGENQFGFLLASFVLSIIGFIMAAYSAKRSTTEVEMDRNVIELAFSVVQLIMTYVYLSLSVLKIKINSNIASIFPLVLALTTIALAYKHHELVYDPRPNTPGRDEEEGFAGTVLAHPNHHVDGEVEIADSRAFLPAADTSTVIDETPYSSVLLHVPTQSPIMVNEEETTDSAAAPTTPPAISTNIKLFSKHVTTAELEKELIVPNEAIEHFRIPEGKDFVDLQVKDMKEKIWIFRLINKPTPVLTEGWLGFVEANGLVKDKFVTFYKVQNEDFEELYGIEFDSIDN